MALLLCAIPARAETPAGTWNEVDNLGMSVVSWDLDTGKSTTPADALVLGEFIGLHYFVVDNVRLGMNVQFSEFISNPPAGESRLARVALLPQIGWTFAGPLFAALVVSIAPWSSGSATFELGIQAVIGAALSVTDHVRLTAALEIPFDFLNHRTIGITPLVGLSIKI